MIVSKLDVAVRQLKAAINLYASHGDPVSIHTLACASQEILDSLAQKQGIESMRRSIIKRVKPERQKEFTDILNEARNFFKHADRDHTDTLDFNPESTDLVIWDCVRLYNQMTKEVIPIFRTFEMWIEAQRPHLIIRTPEERIIADKAFSHLDKNNRPIFFKEANSLIEQVVGRGS